RPRQHGAVEKVDELLSFRASLFPLDADVNIFRVFAEDDYVELVRMLHRSRHAMVIAHRPNTGIRIEDLAQSNVERTNCAAGVGSQRSLEGNVEIANGVNRRLRQPVTKLGEGLLSGKDFNPADLSLAAISAFHGAVKHSDRSRPDIAARAVAFNVRNDGIVGNLQLTATERDRAAARRQGYSVVRRRH